MYADIILPVPFRNFTYEVPAELLARVGRGSRVAVDFGMNNHYAGIVERLRDDVPAGIKNIRPITALLDEQPMVTEQQLQFWEWVGEYYMCPLGDVYKAAMPGRLKSAAQPSGRRKQTAKENPELALAPSLKPLSPAQQQAYEAIITSWHTRDITLLHGVTASGKTEIYIHLIADALERGEQVLYLLPEIALTTQMEERLRSVFGERLGVFHSKFTDSVREGIYRRQLSERPYDVILGVRSSVFLPFRHLGLVIVDEEHEPSYKQQEPAPRYHARNAALMLARQAGAKALLGTATPCIETYTHARNGNYGYVTLTTRYRDIPLPRMELVDIARLKFQKRMRGAFSPRLIEAMEETLGRGEQVILFQNRRGYAPLLMCDRCGWVPRCGRCDVSLTYHRRTGKLECHYCGNVYDPPVLCPSCADGALPTDGVRPEAGRLRAIGTGTERVEAQVAELFPAAKVSRMDLDTAKTRKEVEQIIADFAAHRSDILIGTQMVAKGLDFAGVSLVGVLDADTMLHVPDFRASERTFSMLSQVAGRAGRAGKQGLVIVQTRSTNSPLLAQVAADDFAGMCADQQAERQLFGYPPYARVIFVYVRHREATMAEHVARELGTRMKATLGERVLGPETPPVGRIQGLHVRKLMVKVEPRLSLPRVREVLHTAEQQVRALNWVGNVNIFFDVDPL